MHLKITIALAIALLIASCDHARAAVIYSTTGATYSQNFDSLPNTPTDTNLQVAATPKKWIDDTAAPTVNQISVEGWYLYHPIDLIAGEGGTNGHQRIRLGAGGANTGAFMGYGVAASTERALGSLGSGTLETTGDFQFMGLRLTNTTGVTLTKFTLSYDGEQWRDGGATTPVAQSLLFSYKTTNGAANLQDTGFSAEPLLNFTSPVFANTGSGAAVVGNVAGKLAIGPVTVGLNCAPGDDLWIRWADANDAGNDHALAIDNVSFSADVPEPSSLMLLGAAVVGLCLTTRRGNG